MGFQIYKNPNSKNLGLPLWNPRTKWHLDASPMGRHREYYKGEGDGFPEVGAGVSLVSSCYPKFIRAPKAFQPHINQLVLWFVQVHVNNWFSLSLLLVPSRNSNTPLYPQNVMSQGACPNFFSFCCFHLWTHSWIHQGAWGCIIVDVWYLIFFPFVGFDKTNYMFSF